MAKTQPNKKSEAVEETTSSTRRGLLKTGLGAALIVLHLFVTPKQQRRQHGKFKLVGTRERLVINSSKNGLAASKKNQVENSQ